MEPTMLQAIWFALIMVLLAVYCILDGFDLGAGIILPFAAKDDDDRRAVFNAIGPVWDGNEVWLLTGGGALFAAFPQAYATVFSGFYIPVMLLVFSLVLRAVSLEFWLYDHIRKRLWARVLTASSLAAALLMGVAAGNLVQGIPLDGAGNYHGGFWGLIRPFPVMTGILTAFAFATHGALFLKLRPQTADRLSERCSIIAKVSGYGLIAAFSLALVVFSFLAPERMMSGLLQPVFLLGLAVALASLGALTVMIKASQTVRAFAASAVFIASLWLSALALNYPFIVPSPDGGLHIARAASSALTLKVMLVIALTGLPVVGAYTVWVYRIFGRKPETSLNATKNPA